MTRPLRILTWPIHGKYLYNLAHTPHEFYLPVKQGQSEGYGGRLSGFSWPDNVFDVPAAEVKNLELDAILFQSQRNYEVDQYEILTGAQRQLPRIYLEHNPPREHPTNTCHPVDDPNVLLVHVTHFNKIMWHSGRTPTHVIEHGVVVPKDVRYSGEREQGLVIVNGLLTHGRLCGADIFTEVRRQIPLELVGMKAEQMDGVGEIAHDQLHAFAAHYRFFFNPIRYTSLGLTVCEAMMIGMPIVALATTEMATTITNDVSGFVSNDLDWLIDRMNDLLIYPEEARRLGYGAYCYAQEHFSIRRFSHEWTETLRFVIGSQTPMWSMPDAAAVMA